MSSSGDSPPVELPGREIPGTYGPPFFGPIKDRYDFFYYQGKNKFFKSRIQKYNSTVFRTNLPPGPFISCDSKVIAVLDSASFSILFDSDRVEKKDVFTGTYIPSLQFYGGHRPLAYLDPSEPAHHTLKSFLLAVLVSKHQNFIPNFRSALTELFSNLEDEISKNKYADFNTHSNSISFKVVFNMFTQRDPSDTPIGSSGPDIAKTWVTLQLAPLGTLGIKFLPCFIDDFLVRSVKLPYCIVKSDYKKLYKAFYESAKAILDQAERLGIKRQEACHNFVFITAFNAFGGMMILFPTLIKWVAAAGEELHRRLAKEIRTVVKTGGGVTFLTLEKMALTKSVVYETLRIDPPVPYQYGRAKEDIVVKSHDAWYEIKEGEMIFGYQPLATKDARVFANPEEFVADRFVGDGEKLIKYVYWSNGRETENPSADNKQCAGKDLVVLWCRLLLVDLFLRYDTFTAECGANLGFGPPVKITSLTKAT